MINRQLPIQELLKGAYLTVAKLHKDIHHMSAIPHRHDHYELILCTEGQGTHFIDFKPYEIRPNRLFFLQKDQVHIIEDFERDGWLILFGEELFQRFLKVHPHENETGFLDSYSPQPYVDLDDRQLQIFQLIIAQLNSELSLAKQDADVMLHYVSLLLLHGNRAQIVQHPLKIIDRSHRKIFDQLKRLIEIHYRKEHLAAFYAYQLNMDIKKVNKICREATGNTLFELLQERLITESKIELQTSTESIKTISFQLGFNDPAFFGRFFKKHTGHTPAEFRSHRLI